MQYSSLVLSATCLVELCHATCSGAGGLVVLFGDFDRNFCVHDGGLSAATNKPCIHVAEPPPPGGDAPTPNQVALGFAKALLEQAKVAALKRLEGERHRLLCCWSSSQLALAS